VGDRRGDGVEGGGEVPAAPGAPVAENELVRLQGAGRRAAVVGAGVAVVAGLGDDAARGVVHLPVTAALDHADGGAAVAALGVAVVAALIGVEGGVAADLHLQAVAPAAIAARGVAVVAELAHVQEAVAAELQAQAVAPAAVPRGDVAVVADLVG